MKIKRWILTVPFFSGSLRAAAIFGALLARKLGIIENCPFPPWRTNVTRQFPENNAHFFSNVVLREWQRHPPSSSYFVHFFDSPINRRRHLFLSYLVDFIIFFFAGKTVSVCAHNRPFLPLYFIYGNAHLANVLLLLIRLKTWQHMHFTRNKVKKNTEEFKNNSKFFLTFWFPQFPSLLMDQSPF